MASAGKPNPTPSPSRGHGSPGPRRKVCILGLGQMGLVCAGILAGKAGDDAKAARPGKTGRDKAPDGGSHTPSPRHSVTPSLPLDVVMWGHSPDEAGSLTQTRRSPRLPGFTLSDSVQVTGKGAEAVAGASVIVTAIPVQFIRGVWEKLRRHVPPTAAVLSVAKGIENGTLFRPTQIIADVLGDDPDARPRALGVLSGPTIASELARCLPATMIAASDQPAFADDVQRLFSTSWLRVYTNEDVIGVELAGAVKNVIAIAAGVLDGLQAGYNAKSALLSRGLAEIARLGAAMGAGQETFFGLAGVGDLATSCFSPEGRNRSCGEALGRGKKLKDYLASVEWVVEGVATAKSVVGLARKYNVDMPITEAVYAVLYEGMDPIEGIGRLMSRELKAERVG